MSVPTTNVCEISSVQGQLGGKWAVAAILGGHPVKTNS